MKIIHVSKERLWDSLTNDEHFIVKKQQFVWLIKNY